MLAGPAAMGAEILAGPGRAGRGFVAGVEARVAELVAHAG